MLVDTGGSEDPGGSNAGRLGKRLVFCQAGIKPTKDIG